MIEEVKELLRANGYDSNYLNIFDICSWFRNVKHFEIDKETQRGQNGNPSFCLLALDLDTPATFNTYEVFCIETNDNLEECYWCIFKKLLSKEK